MKTGWKNFVLLSVASRAAGGCSTALLEPRLTLACKDPAYGFSLMLPESWAGCSIVHTRWRTGDDPPSAEGPEIVIRHPKWTADKPTQDIPIWVFTHQQWQDDVQDHLIAGGYVLEMGRTDKYVCGVSNRFNWADREDEAGARIAREAGMAVDPEAYGLRR